VNAVDPGPMGLAVGNHQQEVASGASDGSPSHARVESQ
jgi:hypothetical protein